MEVIVINKKNADLIKMYCFPITKKVTRRSGKYLIIYDVVQKKI